MHCRIIELPGVYIHQSAYVDAPVTIGQGTKIWHFCHIQTGAQIGENCVFGQNVNVANDVVIGNRVKVQNNVSIYTGVEIEDEVFLGPSCVLTNVSNPRSQVKRHSLYEKTHLRRGATIGANATIVCGITLGRYCFIAAGAVVTKNVPDYALIAGTPGKQVGWMSRHGHKLRFDETNTASCPESGLRYLLKQDLVHCLDLDEEKPLPDTLSEGEKSYREFKS